MVTSGLDGWSPPHFHGVQNSAYRFTCPKKYCKCSATLYVTLSEILRFAQNNTRVNGQKIFSQSLYVSRDKSETEALTKGLSKARTREKVEF